MNLGQEERELQVEPVEWPAKKETAQPIQQPEPAREPVPAGR